MQAALERAMHALAFGPEIDLADEGSVRAWLARSQVAPEDAEAILAAGLERMFVYRDLVRNNLFEAIEIAIPRVIVRLGPVFDEYFDRFLRERGPRTHYLRDVTRELLDFCEPAWRDDPRVAPYMMDLARHENAQIEIGAMQSGELDASAGELDLARPVRFIEAARLMRYGHAVHRLSEDLEDETVPEARPTALLVYRNPEHEVRYLELTPLAADILERLLAGTPLGAAVTEACNASGAALTPEVLDGTARLLADLAERGALLGGAS